MESATRKNRDGDPATRARAEESVRTRQAPGTASVHKRSRVPACEWHRDDINGGQRDPETAVHRTHRSRQRSRLRPRHDTHRETLCGSIRDVVTRAALIRVTACSISAVA